MVFPIPLISIIAAPVINILLKILLKSWRIKAWLKNIIVFGVSCLFVFPVVQLMTEIVNASLAGKSGGIGMIGVGIGAGLSVILSAILFLIINVVFLIVRLIRNK